MKAIWKGFIIGIILVAIGAGIIVATLAVNGWKFEKPNFKIQTFTAEHDNTSIDIDIGANTLKTEFYDGDKVEIIYPESKVYRTTVKECDGKLTFKADIKWYASFFSFWEAPETIIKLPKDKIFDINIDLGAGTVKLAEGVYGDVLIDLSAGKLEAAGVECRKFNCDVSAGDLEVKSLTCPDIKADVSAGKLSIGVNGVKSDYTIRASVSAGSCNVSDQTGATDKKLVVDCSAGSISVNFNG